MAPEWEDNVEIANRFPRAVLFFRLIRRENMDWNLLKKEVFTVLLPQPLKCMDFRGVLTPLIDRNLVKEMGLSLLVTSLPFLPLPTTL